MRVRSAGPVTRRAPRNPSDPRASLVSSLRGYSTNARDAYALLDPEASARVWARAAQERNFNAALDSRPSFITRDEATRPKIARSSSASRVGNTAILCNCQFDISVNSIDHSQTVAISRTRRNSRENRWFVHKSAAHHASRLSPRRPSFARRARGEPDAGERRGRVRPRRGDPQRFEWHHQAVGRAPPLEVSRKLRHYLDSYVLD